MFLSFLSQTWQWIRHRELYHRNPSIFLSFLLLAFEYTQPCLLLGWPNCSHPLAVYKYLPGAISVASITQRKYLESVVSAVWENTYMQGPSTEVEVEPSSCMQGSNFWWMRDCLPVCVLFRIEPIWFIVLFARLALLATYGLNFLSNYEDWVAALKARFLIVIL